MLPEFLSTALAIQDGLARGRPFKIHLFTWICASFLVPDGYSRPAAPLQIGFQTKVVDRILCLLKQLGVFPSVGHHLKHFALTLDLSTLQFFQCHLHCIAFREDLFEKKVDESVFLLGKIEIGWT